MPNPLQTLVQGAVLALVIGWVLYIGKDVFVPVVFSILVVYVIMGLTRLLEAVPLVGPALPRAVRQALAVLVIGLALFGLGYLFLAYQQEVVALAPQYQQALLDAIQRGAVMLRIETEPTWETLRQHALTQINIQQLIASMVASVSSIIVSVVVVVLYAGFLLVEQATFAKKLAGLSSDAAGVARSAGIVRDINARIGSYLALKTLISVLLGAICWVIMRVMGLEFAGFWAILIAFLNFVPYIGSFLGVLFPVAMSIVQFGNPGEVVAMFAALTVAQVAIGTFLDPYVMGNSLNLSPFVILVSLTVWSRLWGIPGAFLAVPITAIMAIMFSGFRGTRPIAVLLSRTGEL